MAKQKQLCKYKKKELQKELGQLMAWVHQPEFICQDCARAANQKKWLCKPEKLVVSIE